MKKNEKPKLTDGPDIFLDGMVTPKQREAIEVLIEAVQFARGIERRDYASRPDVLKKYAEALMMAGL